MSFKFLENKTVLVTGGTGSIGSSLVFKLIKLNCKVVRVLSNDENGLYELSRKISQSFSINYNLFNITMKKNRIRFFLGDVRNYKRCLEATKGTDIVIHAAAIKHVNIAEFNKNEAYQINYIGTKNMITASAKNNVSKFLYISTDKVVSPKNIMGKSKMLAEKFSVKKNNLKRNIKVSAVRFGNVVGSRGSVIPHFINLLKLGKNITVTDEKMTRFVMSISESVNLILNSIKYMKGNEIFILKSMKCFRIKDLAESLLSYFKTKNKSKSKIIISSQNKNEKFQEELFTVKEIPYIKMLHRMLVITNKKNNFNDLSKFKKFRISNFNFMKKNEMIKLLKELKILK